MRIRDIRINGVAKPEGFGLENPAVSWKVDQTESTEQRKSRIRLCSSEKGMLCWEKEGTLDPLGEKIECELKPRTDYHLCITVWGNRGDQAEGEMDFCTGKMGEPWQAEWIGTRSEDHFHPVFEKRFSARKNEIRDAKLYVCGLGLFEAYVNGRKAGKEYLVPYYNNYKYEQQIMTYDVTELLSEENTLEVFLGNGWYKGRFAMNQKEIYGDRFALTAELHIRYADGSEQVILTDETWEYLGSDIQESDIYDGETINRLLWKEGTDNPIRKAQILTMSKEGLTDRYSLPVLVKERIPVKEVIHTPAGETVLDMGQNFAGWMEFRSSLPRGTKIVLDFGEVLQEGNFYNANYRTAKSRFVYVSDGREELARPHFTYFGFRYVRVSGWEGELKPEDFTGCVLYSDLERTGYFTCDNEKVNRLYENTLWGMKSNFIDMPTDCPQRDERLGWTGDAQVFAATASLHMDTRAFFEKFLRDLRHYQKEMKGGIPVCIPEADSGGTHMTSAVWSDIATILPMRLYQVFGDIEILRKWYPMMKEWVDSVTAECRQQGEDHYLWDFGFQFGDWLALDGPDEQSCQGGTEEYFISSIYYYQSTKLTCEAARILSEDPGISDGEREEYKQQSQIYRKQMQHIYDAVLEEYFTPAGRLALDTQTAYVIALKYGVYRKKEKLLEQFRKRLKKDDFKLRSGFVGAPLLCQTLRENGMEDLAWQFLLNEEYPGWLYCVNLGATTIWERWNSIQPDGRISENGMNSLNHYSYGSVAQFLYEDVSGIRCAEPGYRKVCFAPCINAGMRHVRASYDSPCGEYVSEWKIREDGTVWIHCEVPFGGSAALILPRYDGEQIEMKAGTFEMSYTPSRSYLVRFTEETKIGEILDDPKGAAYIMEQAPAVWGICSMGGDACREMTVKEILGVAMQMCGMSQEEAGKITEEIRKI